MVPFKTVIGSHQVQSDVPAPSGSSTCISTRALVLSATVSAAVCSRVNLNTILAVAQSEPVALLATSVGGMSTFFLSRNEDSGGPNHRSSTWSSQMKISMPALF